MKFSPSPRSKKSSPHFIKPAESVSVLKSFNINKLNEILDSRQYNFISNFIPSTENFEKQDESYSITKRMFKGRIKQKSVSSIKPIERKRTSIIVEESQVQPEQERRSPYVFCNFTGAKTNNVVQVSSGDQSLSRIHE